MFSPIAIFVFLSGLTSSYAIQMQRGVRLFRVMSPASMFRFPQRGFFPNQFWNGQTRSDKPMTAAETKRKDAKLMKRIKKGVQFLEQAINEGDAENEEKIKEKLERLIKEGEVHPEEENTLGSLLGPFLNMRNMNSSVDSQWKTDPKTHITTRKINISDQVQDFDPTSLKVNVLGDKHTVEISASSKANKTTSSSMSEEMSLPYVVAKKEDVTYKMENGVLILSVPEKQEKPLPDKNTNNTKSTPLPTQ